MIAAIQDRLTAAEERLATAETSLRSFRSLRPWIIAGTIASIIGAILKLLPLHSLTPSPEPAAPSSNTNSLHIGTASDPGPESRALWLTTDDVARREKKSPRTILTWITEGRIHPAPIQTDRAWLISPDYTITAPPLSTAISRQ